MLKVLNNRDIQVNILHFQGRNLQILKKTANLVYHYANLNPINDKELSIVSCWTDNFRCILYNQLIKFNIHVINALPKDYNYDMGWDMRNKIKYYIECLENQVNTKYVLLLDGYDVLFASTNDIIKKFEKSGYRIIFNTSYNNYPDEFIDIVPNRETLGFFKYFNAGCCIGYREDLIKFYKECLEYIDVPNPLNSEQKIIRMGFAKYSNDPNQRFIWVDRDRDIFHTMAFTKCSYDADTNTLKITDNDEIII